MRAAICVALALTVAAAVFAGGQTEPGSAASTAPGFRATGYPIVDEKMTFTLVHMKDAGTRPPAEMKHYLELEAKTNVHMEWTSISRAAWKEKKNLMLASGDLPHAMFGEGLADVDFLNNISSFVALARISHTDQQKGLPIWRIIRLLRTNCARRKKALRADTV